MQTKQYSSLT